MRIERLFSRLPAVTGKKNAPRPSQSQFGLRVGARHRNRREESLEYRHNHEWVFSAGKLRSFARRDPGRVVHAGLHQTTFFLSAGRSAFGQ